MANAFIFTGDQVTVVVGNKNYNIPSSHAYFKQVMGLLQKNEYEGIQTLLEQANSLNDAKALWFNAEEGAVYYGTEVLRSVLADRIVDMWREGFDTEPLIKFMRNLYENPAPYVAPELYQFMEKNKFALTPDGCFLAYKKVRDDYMDCYSGKVDNHVGQKPTMDRSACDPNRNNYCSTGYHFCGLSYLSCFTGERVMIVKINPKDVTSIPPDYNFAKGRCCTYEVVDEYGGTDVQRTEAWSGSVVDTDHEYDDFDEIDEQDHEELVPFGFDHITNPIKRARLMAELTAPEVASYLNIDISGYYKQEREGRNLKPSTVGRAIHAIEELKKQKEQ